MSADCYTSPYATAPAAIERRVATAGAAPFDTVPVYIVVAPDGSVFTSIGQGSYLTFGGETRLERSRYSSGTAVGVREAPAPIRTVADEVTFLRNNLGLTVSEIADWMGVTRPAVYGWLKNVQPQPDTAKLLANVGAAADSIAALKLQRPDHVIKRPLFNGRSALDVLRSGDRLSHEDLETLKELDRREEVQRQVYASGTPVRSLADTESATAPVMQS